MALALQSFTDGWQASARFVHDKLKEEVQDFLRRHAAAELFIVTGAGGAGKSSFIKSITGQDVYVGSTLRSGTTTTSLVPAVIGNKRCLFLDMPGFNTQDFDDWDIFQRLMAGMSVVKPYVQFRGLLYVDAMEENRVTPATAKILTWLLCFCGTDFMPNVTVVTTRWDGLDEDGIETKLTRFENWRNEGVLQLLFTHGADSYHHGLIEEAGHYRTLHINRRADQRRTLAREMISARYQGGTDLLLQIQLEIANGAALETTRAGRWLKYGYTETTSAEGGAGDDTHEAPGFEDDKERTGDSPNASAEKGWGEQFVEFCKDPERIKPWANLLFRAGEIFLKSSFSKGSSFSYGANEYDFPSDADSFNVFVDDDGSFDDIFPGRNEDSGWGCRIM